jgi:hyperosmotically inducible protein
MNTARFASILVLGALLLPLPGQAAEGTSAAKTAIKDSVITTKIKTELAAEKLSSLVKISVETDDKGVVVLSGSAANQAAIDKAVSIAQSVKGVTSVESRIKIAAAK